MTWARRLLPLLVLTAALGVALLLAPGAGSTWTHVYLVVAAAGALAAAIRLLAERSAAPSTSVLDPALRRVAVPPTKPEDLETLERLVSIGSGSGFDLHYRLRPALREIAGGILLGRGIDLDAQPERARSALGDRAWELLRPDRPPPENRREESRVATADLDAVVRAIEAAR